LLSKNPAKNRFFDKSNFFLFLLALSLFICYNPKIIFRNALKGKNTLTAHPEKDSLAERVPGS